MSSFVISQFKSVLRLEHIGSLHTHLHMLLVSVQGCLSVCCLPEVVHLKILPLSQLVHFCEPGVKNVTKETLKVEAFRSDMLISDGRPVPAWGRGYFCFVTS